MYVKVRFSGLKNLKDTDAEARFSPASHSIAAVEAKEGKK